MKEEIKIKNPWLGLIKQRKTKGYIIKGSPDYQSSFLVHRILSQDGIKVTRRAFERPSIIAGFGV